MQRNILGPVKHLKMDLFEQLTVNGFKLKFPFICAKECNVWRGAKYSSDQFKWKKLFRDPWVDKSSDIVFGIHFSFLLPIGMITFRFDVFISFRRHNVRAQKINHTSYDLRV